MENCVIYARFSSYGQNEQSIEAQVRICKETAESKGLKVINIYPDKARTGTNDSRPAFQRMISDAQSGAFQYIIVYMFDRFARNRRDSIMYKEMLKEKYGIRVLSALEPIAEDEGGEFYEMFLEWNAEKYSKRLSKRVKDGLDTSVATPTLRADKKGRLIELRNQPFSFL
jgi:site-specific DNA recombinase